MSQEIKYLYKTSKTAYSSFGGPDSLIKWHADYMVSVHEYVEFSQYISLDVNKIRKRGDKPPASSKYERYDSILKDVFLKKYNLALKLVSQIDFSDGEFFSIEHSHEWYEIIFFSIDEKSKRSISIDFRDGVDLFWIVLHASQGHKGRPTARKKGTAITADDFKKYLTITLHFLSDPDSYAVFLNEFLKTFYALAIGKESVESFGIGPANSLNEVLHQLESRKLFIERRLIESDEDTDAERIKLRGEVAGIAYAINLINSST